MATATTEPLELTAGFTSNWDKTLADYTTTLYSLKYTLTPIAGGAGITFTATTSAGVFNLRLTPAITSALAEGMYQLIGYVEDVATGGETTTDRVSVTRVKVNASVTALTDQRTYAELTLADLQATYSKLAKNTISSATVNGRNYTKVDLQILRGEITFWQTKVNAEQGKSVRGIAVTFKNAS